MTADKSDPVTSANGPGGRLAWVEIARVLAILSVIMQHVPRGCPANVPVLTAALAFFYVLSGFFGSTDLTRGSDVRGMGKRVVRLLKPYVFWNLAFGLSMLASDVLWGSGSPLKGGLLESACYWLGIGSAPVLMPMWFVRDLIVFNLVVFCVARLPRIGLALVMTAGLCCLFLHNVSGAHEWPGLYMFGNFCLGVLLGRFPELPGLWGNIRISFHVSVVVAYLVLLAVSVSGLDFAVYGPLTPLGVAFLASAGVLLQRLSIGRALAGWGRATFFVFCFHVFVICAFQHLEVHTGMWPTPVWWMAVPAIYLICLGVNRVLRQYAPGLVNWMDAR